MIEKNSLQSSSKSGLREMEILFQTPGVPGRDEVGYDSFSITDIYDDVFPPGGI
jgi:hypothetical protein